MRLARFVHSGPLVLGATLLKSPAPTADRDRTVSRRSKPSSRTVLNGEQPYPWDRLQPQDRGAKHRRRCELLVIAPDGRPGLFRQRPIHHAYPVTTPAAAALS